MSEQEPIPYYIYYRHLKDFILALYALRIDLEMDWNHDAMHAVVNMYDDGEEE